MATTTEVVRNIYDDDNGKFITVGPDNNALGGLVQITSLGYSAKEFGPCNLVLPVEMARALGNALLSAAAEVQNSQGENEH